jgi:hypothetical protein
MYCAFDHGNDTAGRKDAQTCQEMMGFPSSLNLFPYFGLVAPPPSQDMTCVISADMACRGSFNYPVCYIQAQHKCIGDLMAVSGSE